MKKVVILMFGILGILAYAQAQNKLNPSPVTGAMEKDHFVSVSKSMWGKTPTIYFFTKQEADTLFTILRAQKPDTFQNPFVDGWAHKIKAENFELSYSINHQWGMPVDTNVSLRWSNGDTTYYLSLYDNLSVFTFSSAIKGIGQVKSIGAKNLGFCGFELAQTTEEEKLYGVWMQTNIAFLNNIKKTLFQKLQAHNFL